MTIFIIHMEEKYCKKVHWPDVVVRTRIVSDRSEGTHDVIVASLAVDAELAVLGEELSGTIFNRITFNCLASYWARTITYLDERLACANAVQAAPVARVHSREIGRLDETCLQTTVVEFSVARQRSIDDNLKSFVSFSFALYIGFGFGQTII